MNFMKNAHQLAKDCQEFGELCPNFSECIPVFSIQVTKNITNGLKLIIRVNHISLDKLNVVEHFIYVIKSISAAKIRSLLLSGRHKPKLGGSCIISKRLPTCDLAFSNTQRKRNKTGGKGNKTKLLVVALTYSEIRV